MKGQTMLGIYKLEGGTQTVCFALPGQKRPTQFDSRQGTFTAWKRPTRLLEESINNGRTAFLSIAQGTALLQGGVPIEIDDVVLGAIGVSGVKASDDEIVATAGVNALKAAL